MIDFFSSWAEQLVVAVIIATIIEMILPNNKNKKYIKMVIGIYILFNIVSPFIKDSSVFSFENVDLESYTDTVSASNDEINQESMDKRLQELYIQELEKNVQQKVEEEGYEVAKCKVVAILSENDKNAGINKIEIKINGKKAGSDTNNNSSIEMVNKIEINIGNNDDKENKENIKITKQDLENIKNTLSEYYEIDKNKINIS